MKRVRTSVAALFCTSMLLVAISGCASDSSASKSENQGQTTSSAVTSGIDLKPAVDRASATVVLPLDRLLYSFADEFQLGDGASIARLKCIETKLGIDPGRERIRRSEDPYALMDSRFGVWTKENANKFGFVPPMNDAGLEANGILVFGKRVTTEPIDPNEHPVELTADQQKQYEEKCWTDAEVERFDEKELGFWTGPWYDEAHEIDDSVRKSPEAEEIFAELLKCYEDAGLEAEMADDAIDGWIPIDIKGSSSREITEEQIEMANKVVTCKEQTRAVERLADLLAEKQVPVIEKYADELIDLRKRIDAKLAEAKAYIEENSKYVVWVD